MAHFLVYARKIIPAHIILKKIEILTLIM